MDEYNTYGGVQLEVGDNLRHLVFKIGDIVDIPDGTYVTSDGIVTIIGDKLFSVSPKKMLDKYGEPWDDNKTYNEELEKRYQESQRQLSIHSLEEIDTDHKLTLLQERIDSLIKVIRIADLEEEIAIKDTTQLLSVLASLVNQLKPKEKEELFKAFEGGIDWRNL